MKKYARNEEQVINYLFSKYGIEFKTVCKYPYLHKVIYLADGGIAEFDSLECDCGEDYGCKIEHSDGTTEEIIICENCYEENPFSQI